VTAHLPPPPVAPLQPSAPPYPVSATVYPQQSEVAFPTSVGQSYGPPQPSTSSAFNNYMG
jgi:hypothetical protein